MRHFIFVREEVHRFLITFCIIYMQMVLYELVGVSGSALSTLRSRSAAEVWFEEFLITKELINK